MLKHVARVVTLVIVTLISLPIWAQDIENVMPTDDIRIYRAISHNTNYLTGDLELSRTQATFKKLSGHMILKYSGDRDDGAGGIEAVGDVYKVLNADEYFSLNKGKNGFCTEPVRWITIYNLGSNKLTGKTSYGEIRVSQLNIDDWHNYSDDKPDLCGSGTYQLSSFPIGGY